MGASSCWLISATCSEFWHMPSRKPLTPLRNLMVMTNQRDIDITQFVSGCMRMKGASASCKYFFSTFSYFFHQASGLRCLCARRCNRPLGEWLQPWDRDDRMYTSHYQCRSRHLLINPNLDVLGILLNILARAFCQDDPGCIHLDKFGFVLCCLIWRTGADYSLSCTIVCVLKFFRGFVDSRVQYTQPSPQLDSSLLRNRFA